MAVVVLAAALVPSASAAQDDGRSATERREDVRAQRGEVDVQVNLLEARSADIDAALATIEANVATQRGEVQEADRAASAAAEDLAAAEVAVAAAEARITELNARTDQFVVEAYVNPPAEGSFDALSAESLSDATLKHAILDLQADSDADVLDQLAAAHEDLRIQREERAAIAAEAERRREDARQELADLEAARAQQQSFAAEAEASLEQKLAESAHLESVDAELSRQIAEEQAAIARRLAAAAAAAAAAGGGGGGGPAAPAVISPAPGGLATVSCPGGGSITVAGDIGPNVQNLLNEASGDGLALCGWGFRSPERQVELRRQHCGTSEYAIYQMPSYQCSPPTARPGRSQHERGLAVDFRNCSARSSACYQWLADHAAGHGLYNLPSEPWHWSTTGR